jgi:magnesium transporter
MSNNIHQNYEQRLEYLKDAIETGALFRIQRMLNALHPAEIAHLIESSPAAQRKIIWELVDPQNEGEVLVELGDDVRANLIEDMDTGELLEAVQGLEVDDMADFLQSLPDAVILETLAGMDRQERDRVEAVLGYPEDTAGGLMNTRIITLRADVPVEVVLRYLRNKKQLPNNLDSIFVVDKNNKFLGVLPITTLLTAQQDINIQEIMDTQRQAIPADMSSHDVAKLFEDRNLISSPVVDENTHKLLGRITIDDVVDVIRDEAEHSVMSMAGLNEEEDLFAPVISSAKRRAIWLGTNLMTAFFAAWVIGQFEQTMQQAIALAVLMGVIPSMGGIAGSQTLTLVIRGIAIGQISPANTQSLFTKELLVGLINGIIWALVVFLVSSLVFHEPGIGIVVAIAMLLNLMVAPVAGVILPVILKRLGIDPALAGSVLLTTITDVVGYAAVLGLAALLLPTINKLLA